MWDRHGLRQLRTGGDAGASSARVCSGAVTIAIVGGTGDEGFVLTLRFVRAGQDVIIGSRAEDRAGGGGAVADLLHWGRGRDPGFAGRHLHPPGGRGGRRGVRDGAVRGPGRDLPDRSAMPFGPRRSCARSRHRWRLRWAASLAGDPAAGGSVAEQAKALLPAGIRLVSGFHMVGSVPLGDRSNRCRAMCRCAGPMPMRKRWSVTWSRRSWTCGGRGRAAVHGPAPGAVDGRDGQRDPRHGTHVAGIALTGRDGWGHRRRRRAQPCTIRDAWSRSPTPASSWSRSGRRDAYPILILHGGPGEDHHEFGDYLHPLADRGFRLLFVDQRAQGASERCPEHTWTIEKMAEDVVMLGRNLGLDRYAVLGHCTLLRGPTERRGLPGMAAQTIVSAACRRPGIRAWWRTTSPRSSRWSCASRRRRRGSGSPRSGHRRNSRS